MRSSAFLGELVAPFRRSLLAANKSKGTVTAYLDGVKSLDAYLTRQHENFSVGDVTRGDIEGWLEESLTTHKPNTVRRWCIGVNVFYKWAVEEEEVERNPVTRVRLPVATDQSPDVLTLPQLRALLKACEGKSFASRRDTAIIRLMLDTGMRRAECAKIQLEDLDMDSGVVRVWGKNVKGGGKRGRDCPFGHRTAQALDRYLRVRRLHKDARLQSLWLGIRGGMTTDGMYYVIAKRAETAGLEVHPHLFRHTFAHRWMAEGGQETDLMRLAGWTSREMVSRYGASAADERARDAHKRMALGDQI